MKQLINYRIRKISTGKSALILCELNFTDDRIIIHYKINDKSLGLIIGRTGSAFIEKLVTQGKVISKMKLRVNYLNYIRQKLKKEFGPRFIISEDVSSADNAFETQTFKKSGKKSASAKKGSKPIVKGISRKKITKKSHYNAEGPSEKNKMKVNFKKSLESKEIENIAFYKMSEKRMKVDNAVKFDTIEVFFATDRNYNNTGNYEEIFGTERNSANSLYYGGCKVSIPFNHQAGEVERPGWWRKKILNDPENPEKDIMIYKLNQKNQEELLKELNDKIGSSSNKDSFIFIHGYNVSFAEAVRRTAQIAFDLDFKGAPITYSWPSKGKVEGYFADEESVIWTVPHLKAFIKNILKLENTEKLHIIAHSMGNRALTQAIKELNSEGFDLDKINQIILAAPDIDSQNFTDVIVPGIKGVSKQITLYASSKDKALKTSRNIHASIIRAGESGKNMVITEGIYTVDASNIDTDLLGHGYFASTKELINDMFLILEHAFYPPKRNLRKNELPRKGIYWLFPA